MSNLNQEQGTKHDSEKTRLDLLSAPWIEGVGAVLARGAQKYSAHNWRKGIQTSRLLGAALRHLFAYLRGEDLDPETGLSHLLHCSCSIMFAYELSQTRPDLDDRYEAKREKKECPDNKKTDSISATPVLGFDQHADHQDTAKNANHEQPELFAQVDVRLRGSWEYWPHLDTEHFVFMADDPGQRMLKKRVKEGDNAWLWGSI